MVRIGFWTLVFASPVVFHSLTIATELDTVWHGFPGQPDNSPALSEWLVMTIPFALAVFWAVLRHRCEPAAPDS